VHMLARLAGLGAGMLALALPLLAADWSRDFAAQPVAVRPKLEARYEDATRKGFEISGETWRIRLDLQSGRGQGMREFQVAGYNLLGGGGGWLEATGSDGTTYSSRLSKEASRVNLYRRGPYYVEVHWLDVSLAPKAGAALPIKGEVVFHCWPEKVHASAILHVTGDCSLREVALVLNLAKRRERMRARLERTTGPGEDPRPYLDGTPMTLGPSDHAQAGDKHGSLAFLWPVAEGNGPVSVLEKPSLGVRVTTRFPEAQWRAGDKVALHTEWLPLPGKMKHEAAVDFIAAEKAPLATLRATRGRALGYDPVRGCYTVRTDNPGRFSYHYYNNRNDYETATLTITNDATPRKVYVCHDTGSHPGSVECGVVLDEAGALLPLTVQISKNFAGEKEEPFYNPKDTPFSETYFPLYLAPGEVRSLTSLHLYQDWGNHPLKQFSSLGAWMDYYHMSTGVTETTCYVPFKFAGLPGVDIADFRPMSGRMWESQPQHDNVAGHSFLRYQAEGKWHYSEYVSTTFHSTGPNWAHVTLRQRSDDEKAESVLDIFEIPQADELRNFVRMRVDFKGPLTIANARENLRLLNIATWVQRIRYQQVAWSEANGTKTRPIAFDGSFTLCGEPLPGPASWAAIYAAPQGNNAFVLRRWQARLGGREVGPAVSVQGDAEQNTILMLVPEAGDLQVKPGDFIEAEIMIMPYGTEASGWQPAAREAERFGAKAPRVMAVTKGEKVSDFPTRIRAAGGEAEFTVEGGASTIPIIVEGLKDYRDPQLFSQVNGAWQPVPHERLGGDGYQVFVADDGSFGAVFLLETDGGRHELRAQAGG